MAETGTDAAMSDEGPDLSDPGQTLRAVGEVSLRLMAGQVSKPKMAQVRRVVEESPSEFPWQSVTKAILEDDVDEQSLVQQGLTAQRDWILRGGRVAKGPGIRHKAKGFLATLFAQLIFVTILTVLILLALLLLKYKMPEWDIYRVLGWVQDLLAQ